MATINLKTDEIPSILKMLGLGGLAGEAQNLDQPIPDATDSRPYNGGGDAAASNRTFDQPAINPTDSIPPIDPSTTGEPSPLAFMSAPPVVVQPAPAPPVSSEPKTIPSTHDPSAPPTKLLRLQQALGTDVPQPTGTVTGASQATMPDVSAGLPGQAELNPTFPERHPSLLKTLGLISEYIQTAAPGIGAPTFGEGGARVDAAYAARQRNAVENAATRANIAHTQAQTQAILNPPGKPNATQLEFDKAGNLLGFRDQRGNIIGPNNPNLTPDMKSMLDAAEGRVAAQGTPESQAMGYFVKSGKTPAEAYAMVQGLKADAKPDTGVQNKQNFQAAIAKVTAEAGNKLDPGMVTDPRKMAAAISNSKTLSDKEKQNALSYLAANPTPASQALSVELRGGAYASSRPVQVLDTKNGNRPVTINMDQLNAANSLEPGRYISATGGREALSQTNLMEDIKGASQNMRSAITNPNMPDFPAKMRAKMLFALKQQDPHSAWQNFVGSEAIDQMTPEQQDFLVAVNQLTENAMAMRSVLKAGAGSDDMRNAIKNTLPGIISPNKQFALKQLDAFEQQVARLQRGIPEVPLRPQASTAGNQNGGQFSVTAPDGSVHYFKSQKEANGFKKAIGQ